MNEDADMEALAISLVKTFKAQKEAGDLLKEFEEENATLRSCIDMALKQGINPWYKLCETVALL
ncbi:hypothetical protein [Ancylomarina longa]|uniref:Uncharacterized protein n=1 Tax=Ancylomarina longa TaxID=2487017 RepID=A0A434AWU8_9BACT|nr:hypothetical protein [Ancylomarina longa]RUT78972.1 hypothetical protein DLK05_05680 [Ancylomarina longa]